MRMMTDSAVYFTKVRLMGIAILEILRFCLLNKVILRSVTFQAPTFFHTVIGFRQRIAMATCATKVRLGVQRIHIRSFGPGGEYRLYEFHIIF